MLSVIGSTDAPLTGFPLESTTITFGLAQATNVNKRNRIPDKIEVRFILFFEENVKGLASATGSASSTKGLKFLKS